MSNIGRLFGLCAAVSMIVAACQATGPPQEKRGDLREGADEHEDRKAEMSRDANNTLLWNAGSVEADFMARIRALQELGHTRDRSLIPALKELLGRPSPGPELSAKNWDAQAAERVIDLHIIESLHALGDDSEVHRIVGLVKQAGTVLTGPYNELRNAASVIAAVGRAEAVVGLVAATADLDPVVVRNAVVVLDQLALPAAPVHQDVSRIPRLSDSVTFTHHTLKEEFEGLASLSHGAITLSPGVQQLVATGSYDRQSIRRESVKLSYIVERILPVLDLDYFVQDDHIVICTYAEAGLRWRDWWKEHGGDLVYQGESATFALRK